MEAGEVNDFIESIMIQEDEVFSYECEDTNECLNRLLSAPIWDGRSFWEAEREMTWVDG